MFVSVVPSTLSANKTGLLVLRFKNIFANATATHTVLTATMPDGTSVSSVTASTNKATCTQQPLSCSFGTVPGGSIVSMYVQFTTSKSAGSQLDPVLASLTFDEGNGGTNDSFVAASGKTSIVANIGGAAPGDQGGLCTGQLNQTAFNTTLNGQQANIGKLPKAAPGLPCTPVSAGVRFPTDDEQAACGSSGPNAPCPANTSFVFFPVLQDNAAALLTLNYPTIPSFVKQWKDTPLFEFQPDGQGGLTLIQLVKCGVTPNPSPDSCIVGDPVKFGQGISFTVSVTGSTLDGSYVP